MTRIYDDDDLLLDDDKEYWFRIRDAVQGSPHKDKPTFDLELEVLEGDGSPAAMIRQKLFAWMIPMLAKAIGLERRTDGDGRAYYEFDGRDLIGKEFMAVNHHRAGKTRIYNNLTDMKECVPF